LIDEKVFLYDGGMPGRERKKAGERTKELNYDKI